MEKQLKKLDVNKSAGPDGFHPRVLKELSKEISCPLAITFQRSLSEGFLPMDWKTGNVIPIHKKGNRQLASNYRPISLTSTIGKVMESIIRNEVMDHLIDNDILHDAQHGFTPGRSCCTQLMKQMEDWTRLLDLGKPIDVCYLDVIKAFDTVPHQWLLKKVQAYGIEHQVLKWIEAFLIGRVQRVAIGGDFSEWTTVISGVPQGSVLGPQLFVLYVNDLPCKISNGIQIYADDTKIYGEVTTSTQRDSMQEDLNKAASWAKSWQLTFNSAKTKVMHIGKGNTKSSYCINNQIIQETVAEKDLGVMVDDELTFHTHIDTAVKRANQTLGLIKRTFTRISRDTLPILFTTIVRPLLEYGNVIWHPRFKAEAVKVEKVQRRATKLIPEIRHLSYQDRLKNLKMYSLQYRRIRGDTIEVYKLMNGLVNSDPAAFFTSAPHEATRGHHQKLYKQRSNTVLRSNSFSQRVVESWNSLPTSVISSSSITSFKIRLDKHWSSQHQMLP